MANNNPKATGTQEHFECEWEKNDGPDYEPCVGQATSSASVRVTFDSPEVRRSALLCAKHAKAVKCAIEVRPLTEKEEGG
jgi:hypothetical protein